MVAIGKENGLASIVVDVNGSRADFGAAVSNLAHSASFDSDENGASSKAETKQLAL